MEKVHLPQKMLSQVILKRAGQSHSSAALSHGKIGEKSDIYISLIVVVYLTTTTYNLLGLIGLSLVNLRTRL